MITPHWDAFSMLVYILMGIIGALCIKKSNTSELSIPANRKKTNWPYIIWFLSWEVFAVFRYVSYPLGGIDATAYIQYFEVCKNPMGFAFAQHVDLMYKVINIIVRTFTDDYHFLFFIIYGFIIISYMLFVDELKFRHMKYAPMIILVYIYIRGFNTIRTNLGAACVLLAIVFYHRGNKIKAIIFAILSFFFQVASIIYAGFIAFCYLYQKKKMKPFKIVILTFMAAAVARFAQYIIANVEIPFLSHGSYRWYAVYSQDGTTFFTSYWKIAFPQLILAVVLVVLWKDLNNDIKKRQTVDGERIYYLKLLCLYDIILIPVTYVLNIWRGYEYLYIARIMLWCEIIPLICRKFDKSLKKVLNIMFIIVFIAWMIFRQYNTWEDSGLMPYIFEPLFSIF